MNISIVCQIPFGLRLEWAAREMCTLAHTLNCGVVSEHNGVRLEAFPKDTPEAVVSRYNDDFSFNREQEELIKALELERSEIPRAEP